MKNVKKGEDALLIKLLAPLVSHWGYDAVSHCLISFENFHYDNLTDQKKDLKNQVVLRAGNKRGAKWYRILQQGDISEEKKLLLFKLMENFEKKIFLPRIPDVRSFLEMHGDFEHNFKQRTEATSRIVSVLLLENIDNLQRILESSNLSSVSDLGSLSDAIKSAGKILRPQTDSVSTDINSQAIESENSSQLDSEFQSGKYQKSDFPKMSIDFYKINRSNISDLTGAKNEGGENKEGSGVYERYLKKHFFKKIPIKK